MNILYINHYAGSLEMGMEFRPYYLAREWQKMGHKVRIIAASYSHLRKHNPSVKKDFDIQMIDGTEHAVIQVGQFAGRFLIRLKIFINVVGGDFAVFLAEDPGIDVTFHGDMGFAFMNAGILMLFSGHGADQRMGDTVESIVTEITHEVAAQVIILHAVAVKVGDGFSNTGVMHQVAVLFQGTGKQ